MDSNRNDRHLAGDRDDEGAVLELADDPSDEILPSG
jgi:hypothetical protein